MRHPTAILAAIVVALGAIWFGVWSVIADRIEDAVAAALATAGEDGLALSCAKRDIGGFPLRFDVTCETFNGKDAKSGIQATMAGMRAATPVYWPWKRTAYFAAPMRLAGGPLPAPVEVTWSSAEIGLDAAGPVARQAAFSASDLEAVSGEFAITAANARAEMSPTSDDQRTDLAFNAAATGLLWQGRRTGAADLSVKIRVDVPPEAIAGGAFDPRRTGLSLPEVTIRLQPEGAIIQASGPVSIDASGIMSGELQVHVVGAEALPAYFATLPAAAQPPANAFVGSVFALGRPATLDGLDARTVTLRIDDGALRLGPLALGRVPPLF